MKVSCTAPFTVLQTFNLCVHQLTKMQRKNLDATYSACFYCCFSWQWLRILATKSQPRSYKDYKNYFNKATEDSASSSILCHWKKNLKRQDILSSSNNKSIMKRRTRSRSYREPYIQRVKGPLVEL